MITTASTVASAIAKKPLAIHCAASMASTVLDRGPVEYGAAEQGGHQIGKHRDGEDHPAGPGPDGQRGGHRADHDEESEQGTGRAPGHHGGDGADGRAGDNDADPEAAVQRAPPSQPSRPRAGAFLRPRESRGPPGPRAAPSRVPRGCVAAARVAVGCVDPGGRPPGTPCCFPGGTHPSRDLPLGAGIRRVCAPAWIAAAPVGSVPDPIRYRPHLVGRSRGRPTRDHAPGDLTRARHARPPPPTPALFIATRIAPGRPGTGWRRPGTSRASAGCRWIPGSRPRGLTPGSLPYGLLGRASRHCGSLICASDVSRCALVTGT